MYVKQLAITEHEQVFSSIRQFGWTCSAQPDYRCDLTIDGSLYQIHILLLKKRKLAVTYAYVVERRADQNRVITDSARLMVLGEILLDRLHLHIPDCKRELQKV